MVVGKISINGGVFTINRSIKIGLVTVITILFFCMSIYSSTAFDIVQKYSVPTSNGKTLYVGGTGPENYTKIQDAINDASDGDTVFVFVDSSPYYENVVVYKSINLIGEIIDFVGENSYSTVIDGNNSGDVVFVSADWVNISRFTIQNGNEFGIEIRSSNNIIKHNVIINNKKGIFFSKNYHYNNKVLNNTIKSNKGTGIISQSSKNLTIIGNEITNNNGAGISFIKCQFSIISHNIISNPLAIRGLRI